MRKNNTLGGRWLVAGPIQTAVVLGGFGFGVWIAHYGFHLLTGILTIVPVAQSAAIDMAGSAVLGEPLWRWTGMRSGAVFPIQLGFILLGAIGSLTVAYRVSERDFPDNPWRPTAPWAVVTVFLAVLAMWVLSQPMEMRGVGN